MRTLTDEQHCFIQTIYLYLKVHGQWPTYGYVEQCFLKTYPDREVEDVEKSLPDSLTNGKPVRWQPDLETQLTIKAIHLLPEASDDLIDFVRVVRYCATKYAEAGQEEYEIESETVKQDLHMSDAAIVKAGRLLGMEHGLWNTLTVGEKGWTGRFIRGVRRFRHVTSVEQYLQKQEELEKSSSFDESAPVERGSIMDENQGNRGKQENKNNSSLNPWKSGSFYLVVFIVVLAAISAVASLVPWYTFPIAVIGSIIIGSVIGALQLRQDNRLSEKNFLELMSVSLKSLFLLQRQNKVPERVEQ